MTTDERLAKVAEAAEVVLGLRDWKADPECGLCRRDGYRVCPIHAGQGIAEALAPLLDEFAAQDRAAAVEAVEAACRLAAPDHLTPLGERIILAAVRAEAHDAPATAPLNDAQPERGAVGHRDGTGAQKGGEA